MNVTSEALGMQEAEERVAQAGVTAVWDEKTQQNYAEWQSEGVTYKVSAGERFFYRGKVKADGTVSTRRCCSMEVRI